jgi:AcrR family transcriptional regulator
MAVSDRSPRNRRRRRSRRRRPSGARPRLGAEAARAEILEAAEKLLRKQPFRTLSVDDLMAQTSLSRAAFYIYFNHRYELIMRLCEKFAGEVAPIGIGWSEGTGDPIHELRSAVEAGAAASKAHGHLLRALFDAAAYDPKIDAIYRELLERNVQLVADRIKLEIANGHCPPLGNPSEIARAMILMIERYYAERLGHEPQAELTTVVKTVTTIWGRTLYGRDE